MKLGFDVGGTFVDVVLSNDSGTLQTAKVLIVGTIEDALADGVRVAMGIASDAGSKISHAVHGSTVVTNAIIEGRGAKVALITTTGMKDVLEIGRQTRPEIFDMRVPKVAPVVPRDSRFEVRGRIDVAGEELLDLDMNGVRLAVASMVEKGVEAVAISLMHSWINPIHEQRVRDYIVTEHPEWFVVMGSEIAPQYGEFERTSTAVLSAYVGPVFQSYLQKVETSLRNRGVDSPLWVMQSNGGLTRVSDIVRQALSAEVSGPAGGVMSAIAIAKSEGVSDFVTFDVGGTSTDVALVLDGIPTMSDVREVKSQPIIGNAIDIHSVGAGGGSIGWIDGSGLLKVGPLSASSKPGPACYGRGGAEPTITDAQVHLGHIHPYQRATSDLPLYPELAESALATLGAQLDCSATQVAAGALDIAVSTMVRAVRRITIEQGVDPRELALVAFGGGGPLYACRLVDELELTSALIPAAAGTLSAVGLLLANPTADIARSRIVPLTDMSADVLTQDMTELGHIVTERLVAQGCQAASVVTSWDLDLRYFGQSHRLAIPVISGDEASFGPDQLATMANNFHREHQRKFGVMAADEPIEVVTVRARARSLHEANVATTRLSRERTAVTTSLGTSRPCFIDGTWHDTAVHLRDGMKEGEIVVGPALIESDHSTVVVSPGFEAVMTSNSVIRLTKKNQS